MMNEDVAILQNFASDADLQALSQESVHELLAGDVHDDVLSTGDLDEEWGWYKQTPIVFYLCPFSRGGLGEPSTIFASVARVILEADMRGVAVAEGVSTSAVAEPDFKPGVPYMDPCTPPTFHSIVVSWRRPSGMPRGSVKSYTIQYSKDSGMSSPVSTTSESLGQVCFLVLGESWGSAAVHFPCEKTALRDGVDECLVPPHPFGNAGGHCPIPCVWPGSRNAVFLPSCCSQHLHVRSWSF